MAKVLLVLIIVMFVGFIAYADQLKPGEEDFVSSTIRTVCDKVNQYVTGEKKLIPLDEQSWTGEKSRKPDMTERQLENVTIRSTTTPTSDKK
jgi:hypothetical protein